MGDQSNPSDDTLERTPARALTFLRAIATNSGIASQLAVRGYTQHEHQEGWLRLHKAAGYVSLPADAGAAASDQQAQAAVAELDAWDEPHFAAAEAALERHHPAQRAFVFAGLTPATGAGSILSVSTFLDRVDALEHGEDRKGTRKADHAAVELLASRGITPGERKRLRGLIKIAETASVQPSAGDVVPAPNPAAESHRGDLLALYAWYSDWSTTARSFIKRRDHLVRLGLAKRKARGASEADSSNASAPKAPATATPKA